MERQEVNRAAEREEEEDKKETQLAALRQKQEAEFVQEYLRERRASKLNKALDQAAEDTRSNDTLLI